MWKFTSHCVNHVKRVIPSILQNTSECFAQQTRNTFVLRRKFREPLKNKGEKYRKLSPRQMVYDFVEDQNCKKWPPIEVILLQSIPKFGEPGDKVSVAPQRAYSQLLLPKLAVYATPENMAKYYVPKEEQKIVYSSSDANITVRALSTLHLILEMSSTEPWTLEKWHIKVACRQMRWIVPEECISLPPKPISGPSEDLESKQFYVVVTVNNKEQVKVRCSIKHWQGEPVFYTRASLAEKGVAVFAEDQKTLDEMPVVTYRVKKKKDE